MSQTSQANNASHSADDLDRGDQPRVYPIESFLRIQALMRRLNMTPADALQLLAEVLEDLDRQFEEYEAGEHLLSPLPF